MNYAEGTKRVALVVYLVWSVILLGVVMLICAGNSNWFVAKMTLGALLLPLTPIGATEVKKRMFLLLPLFAIAALVPINIEPGWKILDFLYLLFLGFCMLLLVAGGYEKTVRTTILSSIFLSWDEKPKASFALMVVYMVAASSVFSWAVVHFSPDADAALRITALFFPCIAVLVTWLVASLFAMMTGFVVDGFQQDR